MSTLVKFGGYLIGRTTNRLRHGLCLCNTPALSKRHIAPREPRCNGAMPKEGSLTLCGRATRYGTGPWRINKRDLNDICKTCQRIYHCKG
jgi:hypothetical protein